jgi:hypothetical protein
MKKLHWLRLSLLAPVLLLFAGPMVLAQSIPVPSANFSGTIATTGTFQNIQSQTNNRIGCSIQNTGTHTEYVYFGPIANATEATSVQLSAGQSVNCNVGANIVAKDSISVTGTSGDTFFANFQ